MKNIASTLLMIAGVAACAASSRHFEPTAVDASAPSASTTLVTTAAREDAIDPVAVVSQETTKAADRAASNVVPILSDAPLREAPFAADSVSGQGPGRAVNLSNQYPASQTQVVAALPPAPVQSVPAAPRPQPYRAPVYYQNPTERQQQICANGNCGTRVFSGRWLGRRR